MKRYSILRSWDPVQDKSLRAIVKLIILLITLFVTYWILPTSRAAHFEREGTLQLPILKVLIPVIVFTFTIIISILLVQKQSVIPKLKFVNSVYFPNVSFGIFVVVPSLLSVFGYNQIHTLYYKVFRISHLDPTFGDLRTILYGISCNSVNELGDLIDCDPRSSDTIWNYPTFLLKLRALNVSIQALPFWVALSTLVTIITIHIISKQISSESRALLSIAVCSPPMILCYERMNFDITILSLLILSAFLLERFHCSILSTFFSFVLISCASSLKFYATPVFFVAFLYVIKVNRKSAVLGLFISIVTILFLFQDLLDLSEYVGKDLRGSVGFSVLVSLLSGSETANYEFYSLAFFAGVVVILFTALIMRKVSFADEVIKTSPVVIFPLFAFLVTWFSSSSYYYRLLLLVFVLPFLYQLKDKMAIWVSMVALCSFFYSPSSLGFVLNIFILPMVVLGLKIIVSNLKFHLSGRM